MILTKSGKSTFGDHLAARNLTKTGLLSTCCFKDFGYCLGNVLSSRISRNP